MVDTERHQQLQRFFEQMAEHLVDRNTEELSSLYHIPTVFVDEGSKQICANTHEVILHLDSLMQSSAYHSASHFDFDITQAVKMSDALFFVQIDWSWKDDDEEVVLNRITSYTLQEVEAGKFDIVVSVADDSDLELQQ